MKWAFLHDQEKIADCLGIPSDRADRFVHLIEHEVRTALQNEDVHVTQHLETLINRTQPRDQVEAIMVGYTFGFNLLLNQVMQRPGFIPAAIQTLKPSPPQSKPTPPISATP
jgi:hypothetical protein